MRGAGNGNGNRLGVCIPLLQKLEFMQHAGAFRERTALQDAVGNHASPKEGD